MKYISLFILYMFSSLINYAQPDNKIVIGKVDSVYSTILKEKRKVWVYEIINSTNWKQKFFPIEASEKDNN